MASVFHDYWLMLWLAQPQQACRKFELLCTYALFLSFSTLFGNSILTCTVCNTKWPQWKKCLVPRPYPLMRRNGLVNQVEFLGLVHTFATVQLSNIQNILRQTAQELHGYWLSLQNVNTRGEKGYRTSILCYIKLPRHSHVMIPKQVVWLIHSCVLLHR